MSDVPRFDCFDDGMREGYNERWVRSSDYDALIAERDALAKDAARYRWLRTAYFSGNSAYTLVGPTRTAEELDTRIDAAARIEKEKRT